MKFYLGFVKFLGVERAISVVTSDLQAIECAAFNIFMSQWGEKHFFEYIHSAPPAVH